MAVWVPDPHPILCPINFWVPRPPPQGGGYPRPPLIFPRSFPPVFDYLIQSTVAVWVGGGLQAHTAPSSSPPNPVVPRRIVITSTSALQALAPTSLVLMTFGVRQDSKRVVQTTEMHNNFFLRFVGLVAFPPQSPPPVLEISSPS